ncbi:MAG: 1-acyl-sn-glycerol-3-phosphate acyltransferase [Actinobacteria bacterium]|nr:1-acyl-sn-glycerol-3-phosphate acyltransferase [Actinomycetota bacterium]
MASAPRHAKPWAPLYRAGHAAVTAWARSVNGFEVAGRGNIPGGRGCLVVCNHLADPDGMYVGAALPPPPRMVLHLVTARHHDSSPLVRELLLRLGLEPVRTGRTEIAALGHVRRVMQHGGIVVIYPEGVPGYSARVQPFAPGAGWLALTPGIDVVPAAIWGSHRVMRAGLPVGRGPVRVAFGRPLAMDDLTGPRPERVAAASIRLRAGVQRLVSGLVVGAG